MQKFTDILYFPRDLASDRWAWLQTHGCQGLRNELNHPANVTNWGTIATRGATSWIHIDDEGFGTSTQPLTGAKYWVIFYPDPNADPSLGHGNMASIRCVPDYETLLKHTLGGYFKAEGILLRPGDLL